MERVERTVIHQGRFTDHDTVLADTWDGSEAVSRLIPHIYTPLSLTSGVSTPEVTVCLIADILSFQ